MIQVVRKKYLEDGIQNTHKEDVLPILAISPTSPDASWGCIHPMHYHLHLRLILKCSITLGMAQWAMDLLKIQILISSWWEESINLQVIFNQEGPLVVAYSGAMDLLVIHIIIFGWKDFGNQSNNRQSRRLFGTATFTLLRLLKIKSAWGMTCGYWFSIWVEFFVINVNLVVRANSYAIVYLQLIH